MNPIAGKKNLDHDCDQAVRAGAGDENRTRTISLGNGAATAERAADLAVRVDWSGLADPWSPWLIAR